MWHFCPARPLVCSCSFINNDQTVGAHGLSWTCKVTWHQRGFFMLSKEMRHHICYREGIESTQFTFKLKWNCVVPLLHVKFFVGICWIFLITLITYTTIYHYHSGLSWNTFHVNFLCDILFLIQTQTLHGIFHIKSWIHNFLWAIYKIKVHF